VSKAELTGQSWRG